MGRYCRRGFSAAEREEIWERWRKGESLTSIGRQFGKFSSQVYGYISPYGGIQPPPRKRSRLALTLPEREEISRGIAQELSIREIAERLDRSPSTVSREIRRNGGYENYRAAEADENAWEEVTFDAAEQGPISYMKPVPGS